MSEFSIQLKDGTEIGFAPDVATAAALAGGVMAHTGSAIQIVDDAGTVVAQTGIERGEEELAISLLEPATVELGADPITLHVKGSGFNPSSVIVFNGGAEPTTFVSSQELTTGVQAATASAAITVPVYVQADTGQVTSQLDFSFTEPPLPPEEDILDPRER